MPHERKDQGIEYVTAWILSDCLSQPPRTSIATYAQAHYLHEWAVCLAYTLVRYRTVRQERSKIEKARTGIE